MLNGWISYYKNKLLNESVLLWSVEVKGVPAFSVCLKIRFTFSYNTDYNIILPHHLLSFKYVLYFGNTDQNRNYK